MDAKQAYILAASKGSVDDILAQIKRAAEQGLTYIKVPRLNDFQVKALTDLGYSIMGDHPDGIGALISSAKSTIHRIDWNFPDEKTLLGFGGGRCV